MRARPLPPIIGATENALRGLLRHVLSETAIDGYDEWIYLNVRSAAADSQRAESVRPGLVDAGLLDPSGSLTARGDDELQRGRELVAAATQSLVAGIDPERVDVAIDVLETVRARAEAQLS